MQDQSLEDQKLQLKMAKVVKQTNLLKKRLKLPVIKSKEIREEHQTARIQEPHKLELSEPEEDPISIDA